MLLCDRLYFWVNSKHRHWPWNGVIENWMSSNNFNFEVDNNESENEWVTIMNKWVLILSIIVIRAENDIKLKSVISIISNTIHTPGQGNAITV